MANAEKLIEATTNVFSDEDVEVDRAMIDQLIEALKPITSSNVVTVMRGGGDALMGAFEGFDGLRDGWSDGSLPSSA